MTSNQKWQQYSIDFLLHVEKSQHELAKAAVHILANALDDLHHRSCVSRARTSTEIFKMTLNNTTFVQILGKIIVSKAELDILVAIAKISGCWLEWDSSQGVEGMWVPVPAGEFHQKYVVQADAAQANAQANAQPDASEQPT